MDIVGVEIDYVLPGTSMSRATYGVDLRPKHILPAKMERKMIFGRFCPQHRRPTLVLSSFCLKKDRQHSFDLHLSDPSATIAGTNEVIKWHESN
jgi:hypothetical protein